MRVRLMKSWHGLVAAGAIALMVSPAMANEPSSKEAQLEQRIAELEAQLENVMTQMQTNSTAQTTLESRIAELQTSMDGHDGNDMSMYWSNGIRFDSANKQFKFKFGGRIMNDYAFFDPDSNADDAYGNDAFQSGTEFRRARLYVAGTVYGNVGFKAEYDFAGGDADFKDVYLTMGTPYGTWTVGHQYEPFGLEVQTSSKYITFMERSLAAQMAPERNTGVKLSNSLADGQWQWGVGVFRDTNGYGDDANSMGAGEWNFTGRIAGVAWEDKDAEQPMMLAVGASGSLRKAKDQTVDSSWARSYKDEYGRVSLHGAQHLGPRFLDTGRFGVDDDTKMWGIDAAFVMGPLHAQAEYVTQDWDTTGGSADLDAWGIQAGYFLTGEMRNYKASSANWDRTSPSSNYGAEEGDGLGAWEAAIRYDSADLNDGPIDGGELDQWTFGVNWYLNPNTRIMWNYVMAEADSLPGGGKGDVDIFEMRFQIDF